MTRSVKSPAPEGITTSAPSSRATASFASPEATAITRAPSAFATCIAAMPMPPVAAKTTTRSPSATDAVSVSATTAVV